LSVLFGDFIKGVPPHIA